MDVGDLVSVINASFEFRATVIAIVLAAYGFAIGRGWPEKQTVPKDRLKLLALMPGVAAFIYAIYHTGQGYVDLGLSVSGRSTIDYATIWPQTLRCVDIGLAASTLNLFLYLGIRKS